MGIEQKLLRTRCYVQCSSLCGSVNGNISGILVFVGLKDVLRNLGLSPRAKQEVPSTINGQGERMLPLLVWIAKVQQLSTSDIQRRPTNTIPTPSLLLTSYSIDTLFLEDYRDTSESHCRLSCSPDPIFMVR